MTSTSGIRTLVWLALVLFASATSEGRRNGLFWCVLKWGTFLIFELAERLYCLLKDVAQLLLSFDTMAKDSE